MGGGRKRNNIPALRPATEKAVERIVEDLLDSGEGAVLCTHRPVLPLVYDAIGLRKIQHEPELAPGEMIVVHARKGAVVSVERHRVGP